MRQVQVTATWEERKTSFVHSYDLRCAGLVLSRVWLDKGKWFTMANVGNPSDTAELAMEMAERRLKEAK